MPGPVQGNAVFARSSANSCDLHTTQPACVTCTRTAGCIDMLTRRYGTSIVSQSFVWLIRISRQKFQHPNSKTWNVLTPWCRVLLEKLIDTQLVKKLPVLMEPEDLLPCSEEPTTDPYLESDEPSPHVPIIFP